jgi:hypothetical protein
LKYLIVIMIFIAICIVTIATISTRNPETITVAEGVYMMSDRNLTIFGRSERTISELMIKANSFCKDKNGAEAKFADSGIYQAKPSKIASSGILSGFVEYNSESIYFICGAEVEVEADTETHTTTLPESYYERVELLKVHVLDGEIPVGKGFVTPQPPSNFSLLSEAEAAMVEGRSTWWIERSIRLFIHLQNVTSSNLEAFEFALSSGPCEEPTPPVRKVIIQLEKPIRAGDQAIINFTNPIPIDKSGLAHCGIVTSAWGT